MDTFTITAEKRDIAGRKTDILREQGQVPAVMYGFETEPTNITLDRNALEKLYGQAGESTVIDLAVEGADHNVLIQDIQRDALTGFIIHADFRRIDMNKKVETSVLLRLVGETPAVKELGGTLLQNLDELEIEALPTALVREIEVDISALATFDDVIRVKDLTIPKGIEVHTDPERTVALVQRPRTEEEMEALDEVVESDVEAVEVSSEKPEDGEEAADAVEEEKKPAEAK